MWPRRRSPLFNALSLTAVGVLFLVTGLIGYTLDRHTRFVSGTPWASSVLWWQVAAGAVLLAAAVWFWRIGLRDLRRTGS